jgi:trigger factor
MQVQLADAGVLAKRVTISYTATEVAAKKASLITSIGGQAKLEGFRPGKAPKSMLEKRYGAAAQAQAEEALADEGLNQALKEHKLRPFGRINSDGIERKDGLSLTVSFETYPAITFPAASEFAIDAGDVSVADGEVEEMIQSFARRLGETTPLTDGETVQGDDAVTFNGSLTVAGTEIRKLDDFHHLVGGYPLFGKKPEEVINALAGKKVGDSLAFGCILPANFAPAEHANKEAQLTATIASAQRTRPAAIDDAMAQKVGAKDLAAMKETLKLRIAARKQNEIRGKQVEQLTSLLLEKITVELPPKALAEAAARAETEAETQAAEKKEDVAKAKADARANLEKGFKRHCIMVALGDHLDVQVTNDDFRDQIMMAAQQTGRRAEDIAAQLKKSGQGQQVAMEIREAKAVEVFLDQILGAKAGAAKA